MAKAKRIKDRMADFEDVASGKKATRVVGQGKKASKSGYKCGGEVMSKHRASRA